MKRSATVFKLFTLITLIAGSVGQAQQAQYIPSSAHQIDTDTAVSIVSNGEVKTRSNYFSSALSGEKCTYLVTEIMKVSGYDTNNVKLNIILDHLLMECGISATHSQLDNEPVAFKFENSSLFILWDGRSITFNEQAKSTLELTMRPSFNNIITISKSNPENSNNSQSSFLSKIQEKVKSVKENLYAVYENGKTHILFSGIAYHKRSSYPNWKNLNEFAVGIGIERALMTEKGNRESVSAMVFLDSHSDAQFSLSYEIAKPWRIGQNTVVWAGANAGLTSRSDVMNRVPVPYVFPTLGLSVGKISVRSILIPRLGKAGGNVLFLFGSYQL